MTNISGGVHEFPHQLIEDAKEDCHFNCTVEVHAHSRIIVS